MYCNDELVVTPAYNHVQCCVKKQMAGCNGSYVSINRHGSLLALVKVYAHLSMVHLNHAGPIRFLCQLCIGKIVGLQANRGNTLKFTFI